MQTRLVFERKLLIGETIGRKEDYRLITGRGNFLDDQKLKDTLYVSYVRSPYAHAKIKSINLAKVREAITLSGREIAHVLPMISVWPGTMEYSFPLLAKDEVLYAGQLVLALASSSKALAEDAAESVEIDYEPLPYVLNTEEALKQDARRVHHESNSNLLGSWSNHNGDFDAALQEADVVLEQEFSAQRVTGQAIEPRGAMASFNVETKELTVWLTSQCPHADRTLLSECLHMPESAIRVLALDVGGGFGINSHLYPEQILACLLSIKTGRPVKWIENRREHVAGAIHSGDCIQRISIAASKEGKILGLRDVITQNVGAYLQTRHIVSTFVTAMLVPGPYRIPVYSIELKAIYSNKGPVGTYRAFGMTQATFARERMLDLLARELGLDPVEVRLRNILKPEEFPYINPAGLPYDSGNYEATFSKALQLADYYRIKKGKEETKISREKGNARLGIGIGFYIEIGGVGALHALPTKRQGYTPKESARLRLEKDGQVTIFTGAAPTGQGLETSLAQIAAEELKLPIEQAKVVHGDTKLCPYSGDGTIASRSANMAGNAVYLAAQQLLGAIETEAKGMLGMQAQEQVRLRGGFVESTGNDRSKRISMAELAGKIARRENRDFALDELAFYQPKAMSGTTAYGIQIAIVEADTETGQVKLKKLITVHDCGRMLNPAIVEGMTEGGCAQGISAALLEEVRYAEDGALLSTTFADYLIPTAMEMPSLVGDFTVTPSPTNPLGVKGGGEGGIIGAPAAIANAIYDAFYPQKLSLTTMITRPDALFASIHKQSS